MATDQKRIVIVDGYSTGRELVSQLLERNVECLHLRSTDQIPAVAARSFDPMPYDADLGHVGGHAAAMDVLAALRPDAVVAGSEWGVSFAEALAHAMGLPTNRIETLAARRDKFEMIEAAGKAGLRVARQACLVSASAAHDWAERHGSWPIVVKPLASAGSDGVTICHGHADIEAAFGKALHQTNLIGCYNDRLLAQSFLSGPQFIVNTVSRGGRHYVSDAWYMALSTSPGMTTAMEALHLLDPSDPKAKALMSYTLDVLAALGIENGAAHTELKWTPEGPALIETGARLMGAAMDQPTYCKAGMATQASVYAASLAGSDEEWDRLSRKRHYSIGKSLTKLFFLFDDAGKVLSLDGLARLRSLPSFQAHYRPLPVGGRVWRTADSLANGGAVYLVHDDPRQIAGDIERFRAWERRGQLYGLAYHGDCRPAAAAAGARS